MKSVNRSRKYEQNVGGVFYEARSVSHMTKLSIKGDAFLALYGVGEEFKSPPVRINDKK